MIIVFYISAIIAVAATVMTITRTHAVHALLYLIVSLLAVAIIFYLLGAPFAAALEVITYAGAIMVLFVFVVMMLNLGEATAQQERRWLDARMWGGPALLSGGLLAELVYVLLLGVPHNTQYGGGTSPHAVGAALFGPYLLSAEIAGFLLLAALVGAYHLGRRREDGEE